jgi:hypothetical protein
MLDLFRPQAAELEPKNNPKSKIQNPKSKIQNWHDQKGIFIDLSHPYMYRRTRSEV